MPREEFDRHVAALVSNKLTRDAALGQEADRAWDAVWSGRHDFLAREQEAQARAGRRRGPPPALGRALGRAASRRRLPGPARHGPARTKSPRARALPLPERPSHQAARAAPRADTHPSLSKPKPPQKTGAPRRHPRRPEGAV
jgi:hypothetical protein